MRVYHDLEKAIADGQYNLVSTCGHLRVSHLFSRCGLERNGLSFYMNAHEAKLQTMIDSILKK